MRSPLVGLLAVVVLLSACHESRRTPAAADVQVVALREDGETSAGAGVLVRADDGPAVVTDAAGTATLSLPPGEHTIECLDPWVQGGVVVTSVVAGQPQVLSVTMHEYGSVREADLEIAGLTGGILPASLQDFRLAFSLQGSPVPVDAVGRVELVSAVGQTEVDISDCFTIADGVLVPTDLPALTAALEGFEGPIAVEATSLDAVGHQVEGQREFRLGRHRIDGDLQVGTPGVPVAGIPIVARILGSSLELTATTDAAGVFHFVSVPSGQLELLAQSELQGGIWNAFGVLSVEGDSVITLNLLGVPEILAGQASLVVHVDGSAAARVDPRLQAERLLAEARAAAEAGGSAPRIGSNEAMATATAAGRDTRVAASATLVVPQGTSRLALRYSVYTAEYPTYVLAQSQFNDVWEIRVLAANGTLLRAITQRINEQLQSPPIWQADGSTGTVVEDFDVAALTATAAADVIVAVASTNIGDGLLPTTVTATLTTQIEFRIRGSRPVDTIAISIPAAGASNVFQRSYAIDYERPADVQLQEYRVVLLADDTATVLHDFGRRPAPAELQLPKGYRIEVPVTFAAGTPSTVQTVPPPADRIRYRFTLFGLKNGAEVADTKSSPLIRALWHMPASLPRYSRRDVGDDDWCARKTYDVLLAYPELFPAINDISGEHGRNIGHKTHRDGFDLDVYHFTELDGGSGPDRPIGTTNFLALRAKVIAAFGTGPDAEEARDIVRFWFESERAGLDALTSLDEVVKVIVGHGIASGEAKKGYYRDLLKTGSTRSVGGVTLDLQIGAWDNSEVHSDDALGHEHHNHVDIKQ